MVFSSPGTERIDFHAGADDGVVVRIDGELVLERNPAVGMHTTSRTVQLDAGSHRLEIEHWQHGGGRALHVAWAPAGAALRPLSPGRLFPADTGAFAYWLLVASRRLPIFVLLVWAVGPTVLFGRMVYREVSALTSQALLTRVRIVLFPALLGPSQILLFGPWTVHATNRAEFLVSFGSLAPRWLWLLGPITGVLVALGVVLPPRWFLRYVAGLCSAGVLLWVQGNLLVANYGLLDGGGLDLAPQAWRTPFEVGLWVVVVALSTVFAAAVTRAAPVASSLLMAFQATVLLLPGVAPIAPTPSADPATAGAVAWRPPPTTIYELSRNRNVIHVVLDMFTAEVFAEIVAADQPAFDRDWAGFTFFADHLGALRRTKASMPAMLTGVAYRNEIPFSDFLARRANVSVFHALGQQGYRLRSLSSYPADHPNPSSPGVDATIRYTIPTPYGSYRDYVDFASAQVLDLSLFRHALHGVKASIYREQRWFLQPWVATRLGAEAAAERPFGDIVFLSEFANRLTVGGEAPVYALLHLLTPHPPIVTDADCAYLGKPMPPRAEHYTAQAQCALAGVQTLLDRLRALDLYERSAIVVTSDHGWDQLRAEDHPLQGIHSPAGSLDRIATDATPLLVIKPADAQGPLHTSYAPTSITDLPATLLDLADLPNTLGRGTSALALDPATPRERTYVHHTWPPGESYFDLVHVFSVNGRVTSPDAWRFRQAIFAPTDDLEAQRRAYQIGLSAVQDERTDLAGRRVYRTGDYAVFYAAPDARDITFDVRKASAVTPTQTVTVHVDGRFVGEHRLSDDAWHTLAYPAEPRRADNTPFCVELRVRRDAEGNGNDHGLLLRGDL